eukprot:TRINITY_DN8045_c0_g2_i1.p1 TRINITY_DN8045_c0_g2~~TRINITY_DN8045_c0_g2_i1.p1  ORF type:complete len:241 (-),score=37.70 TRINITY_DN8045_c0_g2_i1:128-850(-)
MEDGFADSDDPESSTGSFSHSANGLPHTPGRHVVFTRRSFVEVQQASHSGEGWSSEEESSSSAQFMGKTPSNNSGSLTKHVMAQVKKVTKEDIHKQDRFDDGEDVGREHQTSARDRPDDVCPHCLKNHDKAPRPNKQRREHIKRLLDELLKETDDEARKIRSARFLRLGVYACKLLEATGLDMTGVQVLDIGTDQAGDLLPRQPGSFSASSQGPAASSAAPWQPGRISTPNTDGRYKLSL